MSSAVRRPTRTAPVAFHSSRNSPAGPDGRANSPPGANHSCSRLPSSPPRKSLGSAMYPSSDIDMSSTDTDTASPSIRLPLMVSRDGWRGIHRKVDRVGSSARPSDTCSASFAGHRWARLPRTPLRRSSQNTPSTHLFEWASLPCSKRRDFKKGVEHIVPANGAFIRPCVPVGPPSRGDCSPLGWILARLVGCISLDITWECQLELAAVGATFALQLISLLVYPYAG